MEQNPDEATRGLLAGRAELLQRATPHPGEQQSILATIERRFDRAPLSSRDAAVQDLSSVFHAKQRATMKRRPRKAARDQPSDPHTLALYEGRHQQTTDVTVGGLDSWRRAAAMTIRAAARWRQA
jgi:hypothetical protein